MDNNNFIRKKERKFHKINIENKKTNNSKIDNFSKNKEIFWTQKNNKNKFKENKEYKNIINNNFQINIRNIDYINYNLNINDLDSLLEKRIMITKSKINVIKKI